MRFTIRDLLWLTVVVGVLCAWGIEYVCSDRRWLEFRAKSLEGIFIDQGCVVEYDWPWALRVRKGDDWESTRWMDSEATENSKWQFSN
jgi:hypothetical protein